MEAHGQHSAQNLLLLKCHFIRHNRLVTSQPAQVFTPPRKPHLQLTGRCTRVRRAGAGQPQGRGAETRGSGHGAEAGRADAVPETLPGLASARGDTPEAPRLSSEAPALRPPARHSQRPEPPAERPARPRQHWARAALRAVGASRGHALWKLAPPQTRPSPRGAATPTFPPRAPGTPRPPGNCDPTSARAPGTPRALQPRPPFPPALPARPAPSDPGPCVAATPLPPHSWHAPLLRGPGLRTPISAHAPGTSRAPRSRPPH